jgi:transposase
MDVPFLLSLAQMRRIEPFFPHSHGIPRVDDRRIVSGIVYVIKHGLMWRDAPKGYGPHKANRKVQYHYDKTLYRQRHKIENVFGRIKDWRRVATRYDRCAHTFMSAISIAATMCYWL